MSEYEVLRNVIDRHDEWETASRYTIRHAPTGRALWIASGPLMLNWYSFPGVATSAPRIPKRYRRRLWKRVRLLVQAKEAEALAARTQNGEVSDGES